jgi:hypothetical protein
MIEDVFLPWSAFSVLFLPCPLKDDVQILSFFVEGNSATRFDVQVFVRVFLTVTTIDEFLQFHPLAGCKWKDVGIALEIGLAIGPTPTKVAQGYPGDDIVGLTTEWTFLLHFPVYRHNPDVS